MEHQTSVSPRKPRLALMGEFSAGKSTLTNVLLGQQCIPVRVTATSLPPVWISYGEDAVTVVGHDGTETAATFDDLARLSIDDAALIRVYRQTDLLSICDLIDMPGISDPNMPESVWQAALDETDCVVWCTHATQAWRQSEAGVWERTLPSTNGNNILLVSQIDKLERDRDRERVMTRVRKETDGLFRMVLPLSLPASVRDSAEADVDADSDLGRFLVALVDMLLEPQPETPIGVSPTEEVPAAPAPKPFSLVQTPEPADSDETVQTEVKVVMPRRVAAPRDPSKRPPRRERTQALS